MRPGTALELKLVIAALMLALPAAAQQLPAPALLNHEGLLLDSFGFPIDTDINDPDDDVELIIRLYAAPDRPTGEAIFTETHTVDVKSGYFNITVGSVEDLDLAILNGAEIYMGVAMNGGAEMRPQQRVVSVPFALNASQAVNATGDITPRSVVSPGRIEGGSGAISGAFTVNGVLTADAVTVGGNLSIGGIFDGDLADGTVETQDLEDGAVTNLKMAVDSVATPNLIDESVTAPKIHPDAFAGLVGGDGPNNRQFVINADRLGGADADAYVRSDIGDTLSGDRYDVNGVLVGSTGGGPGRGFRFEGANNDGRIQFTDNGGDTELVIRNDGNDSDGIGLVTGGGAISVRGGSLLTDGDVAVGSDLTIGGDTIGDGRGDFFGPGSFGGDLEVRGDSSVFGNINGFSDALIVGDLETGEDVIVGRDLDVRGTGFVAGTFSTGNQITALDGDIVSINGSIRARDGGDVEAQQGDVIAGRSVRAGRSVVPSSGNGNRGIVWAAPDWDGDDRAYIQMHNERGGPDTDLEIAVTNDGDGADHLILAGQGGTQVRDPDPRNRFGGGANLDVGRSLLVRGSSQFEDDVDVLGKVSALQIEARDLIIDNTVTVNDVLDVQNLLVHDTARIENEAGNAILFADLIQGTLDDDVVKTRSIQDGAVTGDKLADDSVRGGNILDGSITADDIADNSITSGKIQDGTILSADIKNGTILNVDIGDDQIEGSKIRDGSLDSDDIKNDSILSEDIKDGQVKEADIDDLAVKYDHIQEEAVWGFNILDGTIQGVDVGQNTISGDNIKDETITTADIQNGSIGSADLGDNSVDGRALANDTVASGHVIDGTLKSQDISDGTIASVDVGLRALEGDRLALGAVGSNELEDGGVGSADLQNSGVANIDLAPNAVTTDKIEDGTIQPEDLGFDAGGGGGGQGGFIGEGNVVFPLNNQGNIWKHGEPGGSNEEDWILRREGEDLVLREPEDSNKVHWRVRDDAGVWTRYGYYTNPDDGGYHVGNSVAISGDKDGFLNRLFVTGQDTDVPGNVADENTIVFRETNSGSSPQLYGSRLSNLLALDAGSSRSDKLLLNAGGERPNTSGKIFIRGEVELQGVSKDDWNNLQRQTPLIAIYGADDLAAGWNRGHDPIVFTTYKEGEPGAHQNRDKERIILGNQPEWADDYHVWIKSDFDNGDRNQITSVNGRAWTGEWWSRSGVGSYWLGWNKGTTGDTPENAGRASDVDGNNRFSRYQTSQTWAAGGYRWQWCSWWFCWWSWRDSESWVWTYWRWQWDPNAFPANAILAKGQFWYKSRGYTRRSWRGQSRIEFRIWMYGQRGSRNIWEWHWDWGNNQTTSIPWKKVNMRQEDLYGRRLYEVRFETGSWARGNWRGGTAEATHTFWVDSFDIQILVAELSEIQMYSDVTIWGSVNVKQDIHTDGKKYFIQEHPEDPDKEIAYVSIEGGEAGTYWRGNGQLRNGKAMIPLPEHFGLVTGEEGLTATVTLRERGPGVFVSELTSRHMVVETSDGSKADLNFDYVVMGVRKGFENHVPVRYRKKPKDGKPQNVGLKAVQGAGNASMGMGQ